ncbi:Integrase recombinase xerD-like [Paramuricea clavata]|uniref:Integrase recombinase xerD-like n=2 Tax=Paramuricea clavata TaxID=317549 RepID=A0A6S7GUQ6_PARCT|nr:Integrase recombinase xerD-like [Paramuricea clavata]
MIPFRSIPETCFLANNKSARDHPDFVSEAIVKLLKGQYIEEQSEPPYCVNPLSVAKGKKLRLVLDLRNINGHLLKQSFRYEDLRSLSQLFEQNFWFFTWDLKSGYHHVDIYVAPRKFLGFSWNFNGKLRYFIFCVLPFGLSSACYCFTKLLRPLVKRWRMMSYASFVYLDDGISGHKRRIDASAASIIQKKDLSCSGLKTNEEKCHWEPMQIGEWLGMIINAINFEFEIPPRKIEKVKKNIQEIHGQGIWIASHIFLMEELRFWLDNLRYLNGYNIRPKVSLEPLTIHTDASGVGYGGYFTSLRDVNIHGHWSVEQSGKSSTFRELSAILLVLKTSVQRLQHKKVKIFSDSQSACRIVQVGSRIFELQNIAVDIFNICFINDIMIETQWIPRAENRTADVLSKTIDLDDWKLHPELFVMLHRAWGPFTIDRFAANYNTQLQRFNSRFWCPETEAVDAFTKNWSNEANWVCSPVALIIPVIRHMSVCKAKDEFKIGVWEDFSKIQDPSLVSLASSLSRVVLNAKDRNTTVRYAYGWNRWKIWSMSKIGVWYLPAQPMFVALYLRQFLDSAKTTSPVDTAVYSIRWGHILAAYPTRQSNRWFNLPTKAADEFSLDQENLKILSHLTC